MPEKAKTKRLTPKEQKRLKSSIEGTITALETQIENSYFAQQQAITQLHMDPNVYDNYDLFEMNKIMTAHRVDTLDDVLSGGMSDKDLKDHGLTRDRLLKESGGDNLQEVLARVNAKRQAESKRKDKYLKKGGN